MVAISMATNRAPVGLKWCFVLEPTALMMMFPVSLGLGAFCAGYLRAFCARSETSWPPQPLWPQPRQPAPPQPQPRRQPLLKLAQTIMNVLLSLKSMQSPDWQFQSDGAFQHKILAVLANLIFYVCNHLKWWAVVENWYYSSSIV